MWHNLAMTELAYFAVKYLIYPIIIGVVSTVCYVLIFDNLFKKILLPGYFSRKYKSTIIQGRWEGKTNRFKFDISLNQTGDKVKGEIIVNTVVTKDGKEEVIETNNYISEGEIKDGFVRLVHKEKDRNSFGFGCFLFQITGGGKVLNGGVIFVDEGRTSYSVSTIEDIVLNRVKSS